MSGSSLSARFLARLFRCGGGFAAEFRGQRLVTLVDSGTLQLLDAGVLLAQHLEVAGGEDARSHPEQDVVLLEDVLPQQVDIAD